MMENLLRNSAWLYDVDNRDNLHDDIPFYLEYAKRQQGETLELGCGTGRVALTLAAEGLRVTGLDLSGQMLDVFRNKLAAKPELADKIEIVHGNMADFSIGRKFSMITAPFRAFMCLTNDNDIDNSRVFTYRYINDMMVSSNREQVISCRHARTAKANALSRVALYEGNSVTNARNADITL